MTTNLTQPMSKKLFLSLLIIAFGAEAVLYLTRFSSLASTLYDGIMVASIFIGWRIAPRLKNPNEALKTKRQILLQFAGAFIIFYLGSTVINVYSSSTFKDFSNDYDQYVQEYTGSQTDQVDEAENTPFWSFFDQIDTVGYDIYTDSLAGLEEVWRLSYMILVLLLCKKLFRRGWENGSRDLFLMLALFLSSLIFGIDHTLDAEQHWSIKLGSIVTYANMGFLFGIILLWTRSLWITVFVHAVYDISATLSWYYFDYALEAITLLVLLVYVSLVIIEKRRKKLQLTLEPVEFTE